MASAENTDTPFASGPVVAARSRPSQVDTDPPPPLTVTVHDPTGVPVDRWSLLVALITDFSTRGHRDDDVSPERP